METAIAVSAFLGAAFVGLAVDVRIGGYLDKGRWLRVVVFAIAFLVIAAVLKDDPHHW